MAIVEAKGCVLLAEEINSSCFSPTLVQVGGLLIALSGLLGVGLFLFDASLDLNQSVRGLLIAHVV